jgi:hypothetical protein
VFLDRPVRLAILDRFKLSRKYILRTLPNISMVITSFALPKKEAGRLNTLINFQLIFAPLGDQFSADDNMCVRTGCSQWKPSGVRWTSSLSWDAGSMVKRGIEALKCGGGGHAPPTVAPIVGPRTPVLA